MDLHRNYAGADFGDKRLTARLPLIAAKLAAAPGKSFPKALNEAELEAFYRFVGNASVDPASILEPHVSETVRLCALREAVFVLHDTTELGFVSEREGMGRITEDGFGFFAHFSLAVTANDKREPLGILNLQTHVRTEPPRRKQGRHTEHLPPRERESWRWRKGVDAAEEALAGKAVAIHLGDREADSYALLAHMVGRKLRFVFRIRSNRRLGDDEGGALLFERMETMTTVLTREVPLSDRSAKPRGASRKVHPPRRTRMATLSLAAGTVTIPLPGTNPRADEPLPASLTVNVVHVREENPPEGEDAVDWKLVTTEPIADVTGIEAVVDHYRARWLIEEFFKALKTGCAIEKRQLESLDAMLNALAIFTPIAVELLRLRYLSRYAPDIPATEVLRPLQILILQKKVGLRANPTAQDAAMAVAKLGGHLKRNGPPGWIVLGRGYEDLLTLEEGARLVADL